MWECNGEYKCSYMKPAYNTEAKNRRKLFGRTDQGGQNIQARWTDGKGKHLPIYWLAYTPLSYSVMNTYVYSSFHQWKLKELPSLVFLKLFKKGYFVKLYIQIFIRRELYFVYNNTIIGNH